MASLLRLITSNIVTRPVVPFRTILASLSRFNSIVGPIPGHRSYSTTPTPTDDLFDQSWVRNLCPKISSMSFEMEMCDYNINLSLEIPDEGLVVELDLPGLEREEFRACVENNTIVNIKEEMKDGMLKITHPNEDEFKTTIMANFVANIFASFHDITTKHSWPYYDMFTDRSILGKGLCPIISMSSAVSSFSIYKEETSKDTTIKMRMPGLEKMKLTSQGLRVSLHMDGVEREAVKTFFDYDTFFIEGKTKKKHYITGIHLPEGIHKNHNMVKRQMEDGGLFFAFLPCCEVKIN